MELRLNCAEAVPERCLCFRGEFVIRVMFQKTSEINQRLQILLKRYSRYPGSILAHSVKMVFVCFTESGAWRDNRFFLPKLKRPILSWISITCRQPHWVEEVMLVDGFEYFETQRDPTGFIAG